MSAREEVIRKVEEQHEALMEAAFAVDPTDGI